MRIVWDTERTTVETDTMALVIRTGQTQSFRNWRTSLSLTQPRNAARFGQIIDAAATEVSQWDQSDIIPNVPEILSLQTFGHDWFVAWGVVLNGSRRRHLLIGEYRFVFGLQDDLDAVLSRVFELERVLRVS